MILISYTGALGHYLSQPNPLSSLGGFISSTNVANGEKNSLFSDITIGKPASSRQAILIAITNKSNAQIANLEIYIESSSLENCLVRSSLVEGYLDSCQRLKFEQLLNSSSLPLYADLKLHDSTAKIIVPVFLPQQTLGLWLVRELTTLGAQRVKNLTSCESLMLNDQASLDLGTHDLRLNY